MGFIRPVLALSLFIQTCLSWTFSTTVDLAWPPFKAEIYATMNSTVLPTYNDDFFPCSKEPVDSSTPRVLFPITGGRFQFNLTNTTDLITYKYIGSIYIGQLSGDTTPFRNASEYITTYYWEDFRTGPDCGETVNLTQHVNDAYNREDISERDIIGINATIAIRNVLFSTDDYYYYPADVYNIEEMYQCGYITIGPPGISTQEGDFCNSEEGLAYIASVSEASVAATATSSPTLVSSRSTIVTSTLSRPVRPTSSFTPGRTSIRSDLNPTASSSSTSQPTLFVGGPGSDYDSNTSSTKARNIGVGVGVSMGTSLVLLIVGILLFRRRKQRKGTLGSEFIVSRQETAVKDEKKMGKGLGLGMGSEEVKMKGALGEEGKVESRADSVRSEALPVYEK
ncbi:hypothetical protein BKA61DRAFT_729974 [Leptodontidium sp. MPI-SDFR-AT-0119]|nr:hypothetical protein BKA61DRAFT_729974 [Leptodontidium sp. MPI-SDFR-AT-0119]